MNVGNLEIQLYANIARLQSDMAAARRTVDGAAAGISRAADAAKAALASIGLGAGLSQVIQMSDQYTKFTAQLKLATLSVREYGIAMADVKRIATTAQADLGVTGVLYARIANGTRELGLSQMKVAAITETVNLALKVSGATANESSSAMLQLSQAFASGTLRGEEFNAVNEAAPRLMLALADGIGVPVGQLRKMAEAGELTSQVLAQALPKALADLRKEAEAVQTISGAFTVLKNNVMEFIGTSAEANGMVGVLTTGIGLLASNLTLVAGALLTVVAVKLGTWAATAAGQIYTTVAANQALAASNLATAQSQVAATAAASTLAAARVAELRAAVAAAEGNVALAITTNGLIPAQARAAVAAEAHTAALAAQAVAMRAASTAAGILRGALAFLGGPIGAIITLLGLGATAWTLWGNKAKEAEDKAKVAVDESTTEMLTRLDKQIAKLKERNKLINATPELKDVNTADLDGIARAKAELDAARAGTGKYASQSIGMRQLAEIDLAANYAAALGKVKQVQTETTIAAEGTRNTKLEAWFATNGTKAQQMAAELAKLKKEFGTIPPEMEKLVREKYKDKGGASAVNALDKSTLNANLENIKYGIETEKAQRAEGVARVAEMHRQGLATDAQYHAARYAAAMEAGTDIARVKDAEIAELAKYRSKTAAEQVETNGKIAKLQQEKNEALRASMVAADAIRTQFLFDAGKPGREAQLAADAEVDAVNKQVAALQAQYENYNKLPEAITATTIAMLENRRAALEMNEGTEAEIANTNRLIVALQERAKWESRTSAQDKSGDLKQATQLLKVMAELDEAAKSAAQSMEATFGRIGKAVGGLTTAMTGSARAQAAIAAQLAASTKDAKGDPEKIAKAQVLATEQSAQAQINSYGNMAAAAKGFFEENSKGYNLLHTAEKAFRAYEMAMAIEAMVKKLFFSNAVTAANVTGNAASAASAVAGAAVEVPAKMAVAQAGAIAGVANQAGGDPYTAFPRMALMAAIMAGLGLAVSMSNAGAQRVDVAKNAQATQGTGTVLGDSTAKSASIKNSLELLESNSDIALVHSSKMLSALNSIDASMKGLASIIFRTTGITTGTNMGIQTGKLSSNTGDPILGMFGINDSSFTKNLPIIGGIVSKLQSLWGNVSQSIVDSGLQVKGSLNDLMNGSGVNQYAEVERKETSWFGAVKDYSYSTEYQAASSEIARQFAKVFQGVNKSVVEAGSALGRNSDVIKNELNNLAIDLGNVSFKDLKGKELEDALNSVISKAADQIASTAMPGLEAFQQIGEGYYQTAIRVASGVERAEYALSKLGMQVGHVRDIENKQGDVDVEMVRLQLVRTETSRRVVSTGPSITDFNLVDTLSGVGAIIKDMTGSVEDLVEAYKKLIDVRSSLKMIGLNGDALTRDMVYGAGGLDELQSGMKAYLDGMFTETEKAQFAIYKLGEQFASLGLVMPKSNDEFKKLVSGLDLTTESGQKLFGKLMTLSEEFARVTEATGTTSQALARLRGNITSASYKEDSTTFVDYAKRWLDVKNGALDMFEAVDKAVFDLKKSALAQYSSSTLTAGQAAAKAALVTDLQSMAAAQEARMQKKVTDLWAEFSAAGLTPEQQLDVAGKLKDAILSRYELEQENSRKLLDVAKQLKGYMDSLLSGDLSPLTNAGKLNAAQASYQSTLAAARGGDETAMGELQNKAQTYLEQARNFYASSDAYKQIFGQVYGELGTFTDSALQQGQEGLSNAESQLAELTRLQTAMSGMADKATLAYDNAVSQLTAALAMQQAMEATLGVMSTIPQILRDLPAGLAAALAAQGVINRSPVGATPEPLAASVIPMAQAEAAQPSSATNSTATSVYGSTAITGGDGNYYGMWGGLNFGSHADGLDFVPFDGYRAELHKGERVLTAAATARMDGGQAALIEEVRALRMEVAQLRTEQQQQTGDLMRSNYHANDLAAEKVVGGSREAADNAAWKLSSAPTLR